MNTKRIMSFLAVAFLSASANATIILQDNFDSEAGAAGNSSLNYNSFANWTVSDGTVDVVANTNGWGISCAGNAGKCVDMDGSTGDAGVLTSSLLSLAAGNYTFSFDISGNQRGYSQDFMTMTLGGFLNQSFDLVSSDPWTTKTYNFTVTSATSNYISFNHAGGDNVGIMLDNVSLVMTSKVPEPSSIILFGLGLVGLGFARRQAAK
jgi:hypothetical protein